MMLASADAGIDVEDTYVASIAEIVMCAGVPRIRVGTEVTGA